MGLVLTMPYFYIVAVVFVHLLYNSVVSSTSVDEVIIIMISVTEGRGPPIEVKLRSNNVIVPSFMESQSWFTSQQLRQQTNSC